MLSLNNRHDVLIEEYTNEKHTLLEALYHFFDNSQLDHLWNHCTEAMRRPNVKSQIPSIEYIRGFMTHEKVLKALDVKYWRMLFDESKVLNYVSSKERQKWIDQFNEWNVPPFTLEAIRPTMMDLMRSLPDLFAQRLRDAHDALSTSHKTNKAQRFDKRLIFHVFYPDNYSWGGGSYSGNAVGAINDIRSTISQLLGGDQLDHWDTEKLIKSIAGHQNYGEWVKIDPYIALRIYKKGTCHMEIHPRLLDQLNAILANGTLPDMSSDWYTKEEKKKRTEFHDLAHVSISWELKEALRVNRPNGHEIWEYIEHGTYDTTSVVRYLYNVGLMPEFKSHQFYATPHNIAAALQRHIPDSGTILEPSAGTGRLINGINPSRVTALDIASLHVEILRAKGFDATECDFMKYGTDHKFDCIVMNPPYSKGRALLHVDKAKEHLNDGGFILAIIPTGKVTEGMEELERFTGGFKHTNINTSLVKINLT